MERWLCIVGATAATALSISQNQPFWQVTSNAIVGGLFGIAAGVLSPTLAEKAGVSSVHALNAIIGGTSDVVGQIASNIHSGSMDGALSDINLGSTIVSTGIGPLAGRAAVNTATTINQGLSFFLGETAVNLGGKLIGDVTGQFFEIGIETGAAYIGGISPFSPHFSASTWPPSLDYPGLYPSIPPIHRQASLLSASLFNDSSLHGYNPNLSFNLFSGVLRPPMDLNK